MSNAPSAEQLRQDEAFENDETWETAQEAAKLLQSIGEEITPFRVGLAATVVFLFLGLLFSGYYYVLPRDSVSLETQYMQRSGHLVMSQLHNDGSRTITDVSVVVNFETMDGELIDSMSIEVDEVGAHASLAGDELEMLILGHTVWDEYTIDITFTYRDYTGDYRTGGQSHVVGEWSSEYFHDKADRRFWPLD